MTKYTKVGTIALLLHPPPQWFAYTTVSWDWLKITSLLCYLPQQFDAVFAFTSRSHEMKVKNRQSSIITFTFIHSQTLLATSKLRYMNLHSRTKEIFELVCGLLIDRNAYDGIHWYSSSIFHLLLWVYLPQLTEVVLLMRVVSVVLQRSKMQGECSKHCVKLDWCLRKFTLTTATMVLWTLHQENRGNYWRPSASFFLLISSMSFPTFCLTCLLYWHCTEWKQGNLFLCWM